MGELENFGINGVVLIALIGAMFKGFESLSKFLWDYVFKKGAPQTPVNGSSVLTKEFLSRIDVALTRQPEIRNEIMLALKDTLQRLEDHYDLMLRQVNSLERYIEKVTDLLAEVRAMRRG